MNDSFPLGRISEEREKRILSRANDGQEARSNLGSILRSKITSKEALRVEKAYDFAKGIEYKHGGLSSGAYLAHPVRVACLALTLSTPPSVDAAELALLHNLFEVSDVTEKQVEAHFGAEIAAAIRILTVDRKRTDPEYTKGYYAGIESALPFVGVVKALDKLDNLFLLYENPDPHIKKRYLDDIETYVIPLAEKVLPGVVNYMKALVVECRVPKI